MRILYHHRTASKDGQSTHIEEMIRGMREVGCVVDEASPQVATPAAVQGSPGWVGTMKNWMPRPLYELAEIAYSWVAYRRLARLVRASRPDAIYERYNLYLVAGVWAKRSMGVPLILEVNAPMALERRQYGGLSWPRLAAWIEHYVWRNADAILPVTRVLAEHMVACGVDPQRIVVIPNGINEEHYAGLPDVQAAKARLGLQGRLVIGFIGFVREWDRLDRIMRWVARNRDLAQSPHLLVIGDGPARAEIEQCARELGATDRLTFTGVVAREEVPALAMAFDVALQTALVPYASPLCLFEYLALGKAIVAPDQPNHHEILTAGEDSLLYDPKDDRSLERALDTLASDPSLRARIADGAARLVGTRGLTWKQHATTVVNLIKKIAGKETTTVADAAAPTRTLPQ